MVFQSDLVLHRCAHASQGTSPSPVKGSLQGGSPALVVQHTKPSAPSVSVGRDRIKDKKSSQVTTGCTSIHARMPILARNTRSFSHARSPSRTRMYTREFWASSHEVRHAVSSRNVLQHPNMTPFERKSSWVLVQPIELQGSERVLTEIRVSS